MRANAYEEGLMNDMSPAHGRGTQAPELHTELQRQLAQSQSPTIGGGGSSSAGRGQAGAVSDFWYDVGGWVCFVGIVIGIVALSRSAAPATPVK